MCEKMTKNESVQALLILNGEDARKFNLLKNKRGLKNNVELIRQILKEAFDREVKPHPEGA